MVTSLIGVGTRERERRMNVLDLRRCSCILGCRPGTRECLVLTMIALLVAMFEKLLRTCERAD